MNIVRAIFSSLATVVSIYSSLCLVRIFLTWIPQANYSKFGQFMSAICDPYLNIFSRVRFLRIGMIDFSPILAFALLSALASVDPLRVRYSFCGNTSAHIPRAVHYTPLRVRSERRGTPDTVCPRRFGRR